MIFDWNNPIGLGLFFMECAAALLMVGAMSLLLSQRIRRR
jgi:hypothetical protein